MTRKGEGIVVVLVVAAFVVTFVRLLAAIDKEISKLLTAGEDRARRAAKVTRFYVLALLPRNFFVHTFSARCLGMCKCANLLWFS